MTATTRDLLIDAATRQFSERGFYGTSIAEVADAVGLTKQALLHHFGTKERLYGEVLTQIAERLTIGLEGGGNADPAQRFEETILRMATAGPAERMGSQLIIRELMDNQARLDQVETWVLKPFLDRLVEMLKAVPGQEDREAMDALAAVYQLLGAINYFDISHGTLAHMYGKRAFARMKAAHPEHLRAYVQWVLAER